MIIMHNGRRLNELPKNGISHLIYWQDNNDYLVWCNYLKEKFPVGLFLIGSKLAGFNTAMNCLKSNQPLFIFNETGGSASIVGDMINFMEKCKYIRRSFNFFYIDFTFSFNF